MMAGSSHVEIPSITTDITTYQIGQDTLYDELEPDVQWNLTNVRDLISLVEFHWDEFYDKTIKKKVLWKKISELMRANNHICSADDCDKKWRNLKKSHMAVLKKQTQGDFTHKFPHFEQIHNFLGKELDPHGIREKVMRKMEKSLPTKERSFPRVSFDELFVDGDFEWNEVSVNLLMHLIVEHKPNFEKIKDRPIDSVWENICSKMNDQGLNLSNDQCQRKWVNLLEGFRHHQAEGEHSGIFPHWAHYETVLSIIRKMNVPVTVCKDNANIGYLSCNGSPQRTKIKKANLKRRRRISNTSDEEEQNTALAGALDRLESCMNVEHKLKRVEEKVQSVAKEKRTMKLTNELLRSILTELRNVNAGLESKSRRNATPKTPDEMLDGTEPFDETPIMDEETLVSMTNFANLLKQEQDSDDENPDTIIYVQGS